MGYWANTKEFESADVAFETRAIFKGGFVDIIPSHNNFKGDAAGKKALIKALKAAHADLCEAAEARKYDALYGSAYERVVLVDNDEITIRGTTNGSCGYLYLMATPK